MKDFCPDYKNIIDAATNRLPARYPLYEHTVSSKVIGEITGTDIERLQKSDELSERREFFKLYCNFFRDMGYDCVPWECCIGKAMPGSGSLGGHKAPEINNRNDFEKYPWEKVSDIYFDMFAENFELLRAAMPEGMKAVGGVGNGIFECVQEIVGYENLCMISIDDPELYGELFCAVGQTNLGIWKKFLDNYADIYAVCRFGDDLGYKAATMLSPDDITTHIVPQYKAIVEEVHRHGKPFLLHSCGCIFAVMEEMISEAKIDAKHSNEDVIAPFDEWVSRYGQRIGNFGGIDMDVLCTNTPEEVRRYTLGVLERNCKPENKGLAFGTGNSIADYVPADGYIAMVEAVRQFRGD
jgi:uroporphyrinogen decarboxylase